jgi:hypothetical protein
VNLSQWIFSRAIDGSGANSTAMTCWCAVGRDHFLGRQYSDGSLCFLIMHCTHEELVLHGLSLVLSGFSLW